MHNMLELMGYEYKKLFRKKSTWVTLAFLLVLLLFNGVENLIGTVYREDVGVGSKYEEMQKNKEAARKISGRVFDETLILEANDALAKSYAKGNSEYERYRPYRPIMDIYSLAEVDNLSVRMLDTDINKEDARDYYIRLKDNMKKIINGYVDLTKNEKEILKGYFEEIKTPFTYGFSQGYEKFAYSTSAIGLFLILGITYCLAPLFSGEYSTKMDALILTSKVGKNKQITAKILTGFTFSLMISMFGIGVSIIELFCVYGTDGANMPIQIWGNTGILMVYPISCVTGMILISVCLSIAVLFMTGITMLLSAKLKSTYHVIILSSVITLVPLMFHVPGNFRIINFLYHLLPVNMMSFDKIFSTYLYTIGTISIIPYHFIPVFCIVSMCVLSVGTYRTFKKHQIA